MFELVDDGTLDTVVECTRCGKRHRYSSENLVDDSEVEEYDFTDVNDVEELDELRVTRAIEDAEDSHECEETR